MARNEGGRLGTVKTGADTPKGAEGRQEAAAVEFVGLFFLGEIRTFHENEAVLSVVVGIRPEIL